MAGKPGRIAAKLVDALAVLSPAEENGLGGNMDQATSSLAARFRELKADQPELRARDAAERLGVTEGELVTARADGRAILRLAPRTADFAALVEGLREVGPVMTLTRNEAAVHETHGTVDHVSIEGSMGQVVGPIDLRLFLSHWHVGFAVTEETRSGMRDSFQVFDSTGTAVLKVYAVDGTDRAAWDRLRDRHACASEAVTAFAPRMSPAQGRPDAEIDRDALRQGWLSLEHSHEFHRLLRQTGAGREQALRLAGEDLAQRVDTKAIHALLEGAAGQRVPITCFVGNPGCIQIYAGPVERIVPMGPWLNMLDPTFNLHLRTDLIASAWVVVKPTRLRGQITSLELFDAEGTLACQFFGARPPGEGEREAWRALVESVARIHSAPAHPAV